MWNWEQNYNILTAVKIIFTDYCWCSFSYVGVGQLKIVKMMLHWLNKVLCSD